MDLGSASLGIVQGGMNHFLGKDMANHQAANQAKLNKQQFGHQKLLNQQGFDLSKKMWDETNYGAQRKHLEDAGLSVGLMYGKGGAGGSTANAGSGGSAQGGQAAKGQEGIMDLLNASMLKAQIENINADTKQKEASADGIYSKAALDMQQIGKVQAEANKIIAETETEGEKQKMLKAQTDKLASEENINKLRLDLMKHEKQILKGKADDAKQGFTGNYISDVMNGIFGLDMSNPDDRLIAKAIVGGLLGSQVVSNLSGVLGKVMKAISGGKAKTPNVKQLGDMKQTGKYTFEWNK